MSGQPLVCACGHNVTVHWAGEGCKKCNCFGYRRGASATAADRARARATLDESTQFGQVEAIAALLAAERKAVAARFMGLVDAWEHVAAVNASAAPGSHDDGLAKGLTHAAAAVRRTAEVDL